MAKSPAERQADAGGLKGKRGFARLVNAARYSIDGLRVAWRNEQAFRQEVLAAVVLLPIAALVPVPLVEKLVLGAVVLLVLIVELLNSAIETAIDRDSLNIDPLGKRAKDFGSAAVMLSLVVAAVTWAAILLHRFA